MNVIVIGSGGREVAIIKSILKSELKPHIICLGTHNNPYIVSNKNITFKNLDICNNDIVKEYLKTTLVDNNKNIEYCIIGPEAPLANGIVDILEKELNIQCIGPRKNYAQIESSKVFTRDLIQSSHILNEANINYVEVNELQNIYNAFSLFDEVVLKKNGLCGGKGVLVQGDHFKTKKDGKKIAEEWLKNNQTPFVIEKKEIGEEFSLITFSDGKGHFYHCPVVQDYKRAFEENKGPNTGGMGCITDVNNTLSFLNNQNQIYSEMLNEHIIQSLEFSYCSIENNGYRGILYGSYIVDKNNQIKIIEYNCRFGDPECMNILHLLEQSLHDICIQMISGSNIQDYIKFKQNAIVTKYLVPKGYPENPKSNYDLYINNEKYSKYQSQYYYASAEKREDHIYTLKSRTLAVVGIGDTLKLAAKQANMLCESVVGPVTYRQDIGLTCSTLYEKAGVSIEEGNKVVSNIQDLIKSTHTITELKETYKEKDFCGMYPLKCIDNDLGDKGYLVSSTDGVGTKSVFLKKYFDREEAYKTLGQDIISHCINDIIVSGAKPLFFLDYYGAHTLESKEMLDFIKGLTETCREYDCALVGGETAEMPSVYKEEQDEMIGTIIGYVNEKNKMTPQTNISNGDYILGFKSHGSHTNGYSLIRNILDKLEDKNIPQNVLNELGHHHVCYYDIVKKIIGNNIIVNGMAHITGGGFYENIGRILPENMYAHIETKSWELPECFQFLQDKGEITNMEMFSVFNCGIGFTIFISPEEFNNLKMLDIDLDYIEVGRICEKDTNYSTYSKINKKNRNVISKERVYMYL